MFMRNILGFVKSLGNTSIEVREWNESTVRKARLPNGPDFNKLTTQLPDLKFSGWSLAHAVVKADYLDRRNLVMPGFGFLLQACNLIDLFKSPIELKVGASKSLNDFSSTSLSGRVGQGMAILYGHRLGLKFSAHLRSYVESLPAGSPGFEHKIESMADFLFADDCRTVVIESKGSFSLKDNDPSAIKSVLKKALNGQVDPWLKYLKPAPENGYVIYTCLREESWGAPSALSIVDPLGEGDSADLPFSREQVVRENYGTWLRVMGLSQAAERLMRQFGTEVAEGFEEKPVETVFLVYEHAGREIAIHPGSYDWYLNAICYPFVVGVDLSVLKAISVAIENPGLALADLVANLPSQVDALHDLASIFPDGSFFGLIPSLDLRRQVVRL